MRPLLLYLLLGPISWAQIQITASDLPSPNSSYTVSQSRPNLSLNFLATGPGFTWDYAQLPVDTQLTVEWKSPVQVPQYSLSCGNFSLQALFLKIADSVRTPGFTIRDLYAFLRKGSQQMAIHGIGASVNGLPVTQCYNDPDELYMLPMSYEREDSTTFWLRLSFSVPNFGNVTFAQAGYRLHKVDGYGQLTTPYGTFQVLRLKRNVRQRDTVYLNGIPIQRTDTSYTELEWLGQGQGIPLLRVQGSMRMTGGNPTFIPALIQFKDEQRMSSLQHEGGSRPTISPNPCRGLLRVSAPNGSSYALYNLIGKLLYEGQVPEDGTLRIPPTLPEGIYFLRLTHEGRESWHRFVLVWH
ncbi:MAG: T9SS type A sorting domain-containing protein [Bacteroidia bacterium]|nr:T9SS type A sorting domain-containing protein [Bacteroidia bacterium]